MTPEERQALREKHGKFGFRDNRTFCVFCLDDDGLDIPYPCDVIKVLDALDEADRRAVANYEAAEGYRMVVRAMVGQNSHGTITELANCDHWVTVKRSGQYGYASSVPPEYWTHTYCPKCGEKL